MLLPSFPEVPPHLLRTARPLTCQPDEIIRCKGTHADTVYILLAGRVRIINEFASGDRYVFAIADPPTFLGEYEALAGTPYYAATCEAETVCDLLAISIDAFGAWLQHDAAAAFSVACMIARKSWPISDEYGQIKYLTVQSRLLAYLQKQLPPTDAAVRLPMRRQDIADAIGTSLKTVNRSVERLRAEGILSLDRGKIALTPEQCAKVRTMDVHQKT